MSGRNFGEGCSSPSAQASGSKRRRVVHPVLFEIQEEAKVCNQISVENSHPENFQRLPKEIIDMQVQVKEIVGKLETVRILGFCGMGGLGKTALAKTVFNELNNSNFDYSCFVSDAKLITGTEDDVKKRLWECLHFQGKKVGGECNLAVLRGKRMLLVLDDVSDRDGKVLLDLAEDTDPRSRFISTSRESDLLNDLGEVHRVPYLDSNHAKLLFRRHAVRDGALLCPELEGMLEDIVNKCDGLPLALEVLGKSLRGKVKQVWKQTLLALEKAEKVDTLNRKLWAKLRISFENVGEKEQQVFLDATNFFVGNWKWTLAEAKAAWTVAYETGGELLWQTLVDMSLVDNVEDNDHIRVHEQLQCLGRMIASEPKNKGKYVIFDEEEAPTTLEERLAANGQFLQVDREVAIDGVSSMGVHQCTNLEVPTKLVLLKCVGHGLVNPSLQKHLAVLEVRNLENIPSSIGQLSHLKRLEIGCIPNSLRALDRRIDVEHATSSSLPESFGQLTVLEDLMFSYCDSLQSLPESFGQLRALQCLTLWHCSLLESLPESFGQLRALQHLDVFECPSLRNLPKSFGQLTALQHLDLFGCPSLRNLPESFGQLRALQGLDLIGCRSLRNLPESFGQLTVLEHLTSSSCNSLQSLPESFVQLKALQHLEFHNNDSLQSLPESFGQLTVLEHLTFSYCNSLQSLPESFGQLKTLQHLEFHDSDSLQNLPESFGQLRALQHLAFEYCSSLQNLPDTLGQLSALERLKVSWCQKLKCLPHSVGQLSNLKYFTLEKTGIESLPDSMGDLSALTALELIPFKVQALPYFIGHLSALTKLSVESPELQSLPDSFGQLSALTELSVEAPELQSLPDSFGHLSALTQLSVKASCLQSLPDSFGQLSALTKLVLNSFDLQSLPDSFGQLFALTELSIKAIELQSLPDSIGQLLALTELAVQSFELQSLPDSIGKLSGLTRLSLSHCSKLKSLLESLGSLSSLSQLELLNCFHLCNLPKSSGQLTKLKLLSFGSREFPERWEQRDRFPERLRTLPNGLGDFPNLQHLQLWGFSAASIPDSVRGMPSLRYVDILDAERVDEPWPVWLVDKIDPNTRRPVGPEKIYQLFEVCDGRLFLVEEVELSWRRRSDVFLRLSNAKAIARDIVDL